MPFGQISSSSLSTALFHLPFLLLASPTTTPLHLISAALDTDALHLTLGCQAPLNPSLHNNGEFPACAAMTTGYVFRVENEATVHFLQSIGTTGALTQLKVSYPDRGQTSFNPFRPDFGIVLQTLGITLVCYLVISTTAFQAAGSDSWRWVVLLICTFLLASRKGGHGPVVMALYSGIVNWFIMVLTHDAIFVQVERTTVFQGSLLCLFVSRVLFAYVLSERTKPGWYGAAEPGVTGSLLALLSRDRWVRLDGDVDDLKAVTSGSWLRPETGFQDLMSQLSCLLVWLSVLVTLAATDSEKLVLVVMVLVKHIVAAWSARKSRLVKNGVMMHGRKMAIDESRGVNGVVKYGRRLEMADELIKEFGRRDWAEQMGMVKPEDGKAREVIM